MKILTSFHDVRKAVGDKMTHPLLNTLEYLIHHLHHNFYILKVSDSMEMFKVENHSSPEGARKTLRNKLVKNAKTMRVMNCIIKYQSPTPTTTSEYPSFFEMFASKIPKGVYVLNLTDALVLRSDRHEPWEILGHGLIPEKYRKEFVPIYGGSGGLGYDDIPIPNYDDILVAIGSYKYKLENINPELDWSKKQDKVVFRGGSTGCGRTSETNSRIKASSLPYEWLDAGITTKTSQLKYDSKVGLGYTENIKKGSFMGLEEQSTYKYILHIDGNVAAFRLLKFLLTGSLCLRVKSHFTLWYDQFLEEGKHFISVKQDLSDLEDVFKWCQKNDKKCQKIAERARKLALKLYNPLAIQKGFLNALV